jgi:hypothetical protein
MNDCENLWNRIVSYSGKLELKTKTSLILSYKVENDVVFWIPREPTQKKLWPQSKSEICKCIEARTKNYLTSNYPGTARSYKWALLNHSSIWKAI